MEIKFFVKVKTRAKRESVERFGEHHLLVAVAEPPQEGRANLAVIKAIAVYFGLPSSAVRIVSGQKARQKQIEISF